MRFLSRMERRFRDYAIVNLTLYLVAFQAFTAVICIARPEYADRLVLDHDRLLAGEWWRLFTMVLMPPATYPILIVIALYFFYMMGTALEQHWGTFRFNVYMLVGYLGTIAAALIPGAIVTNGYLMGSVLLAFAWLYPDFTILLFFILPCKMKWLGLAAWIGCVFVLFDGDWGAKGQVAAGIANFLLFFHTDLWQWARTARRKFKNEIIQANREAPTELPMHVCTTCGVTLKTSPRMEFRYCPECTGTPCYCIEHIHNHVHR